MLRFLQYIALRHILAPMSIPINRRPPSPRTLAWVPVALIHLALCALWRGSVPAAPRIDGDEAAMQWVWIKPPAASPPPVPAPPAPVPPRRAGTPAQAAPAAPAQPPSAGTPAVPPASPVPAAPTAEPAITIVEADPFAQSAPGAGVPSDAAIAARIRAQSRRDLGKIDRDLRRESPSQIHAPVSTPQTRLIAGLNDAKVVHWNEAAQVEEIPDATGGGRRIAKIKTFMGTYCTTHDSNRSAADGFSPNTKGPKLTNCPK